MKRGNKGSKPVLKVGDVARIRVINGKTKEHTVKVVPKGESNFHESPQHVAIDAPILRPLIGLSEGTTLEVKMPNEGMAKITLLEIERNAL